MNGGMRTRGASPPIPFVMTGDTAAAASASSRGADAAPQRWPTARDGGLRLATVGESPRGPPAGQRAASSSKMASTAACRFVRS